MFPSISIENKPTMESEGSKLWRKLKELNIDLGNITKNVIEGWFDSTDQDLLNFLTFIAENVTEDNTLTPWEEEKYKQLKFENKILHLKQYERAIQEVAAEYEGLFDLEENLEKVAQLETRKSVLMEYEDYLDAALATMRGEKKEAKAILSSAEYQKLQSNVVMEEAAESCLKAAEKLDETCLKLCEQLESYKTFTIPTSVSAVSLNELTRHYNDVIALMNLFYTNNPVHLSPKSFTRENSTEDDYLDQIVKRVVKSTEYKFSKIKLLEILKSVGEFQYTSLTINQEPNSRIMLEANILYKEDVYKRRKLDLGVKFQKVANKYVHEYQLIAAEDISIYLKNASKRIDNVSEKFFDIFGFWFIFCMFFNKNIAHLKKCCESFRKSTNIIDKIERCKSRIESMTKATQEQMEFKKLPIEQRSVFLKLLINFLCSENSAEKSLISAGTYATEIGNEIKEIKRKMFIEQPKTLEVLEKNMISNIRDSKNFLTVGPTSELVCVPYRMWKVFKEIDETLALQNNLIHSSITMLNETTKLVSKNQWFQYKRNLWMYFLVDPKKVKHIVELIEKEVATQTKENL